MDGREGAGPAAAAEGVLVGFDVGVDRAAARCMNLRFSVPELSVMVLDVGCVGSRLIVWDVGQSFAREFILRFKHICLRLRVRWSLH